MHRTPAQGRERLGVFLHGDQGWFSGGETLQLNLEKGRELIGRRTHVSGSGDSMCHSVKLRQSHPPAMQSFPCCSKELEHHGKIMGILDTLWEGSLPDLRLCPGSSAG